MNEISLFHMHVNVNKILKNTKRKDLRLWELKKDL